MSREKNSLEITDLSLFCKNLSKSWPEKKPSHLALLNLVAKSTGYKNYQHYLSHGNAKTGFVLDRKDRRRMRLLDDQGVVIRWPSKFSDQSVIIWYLASQLPMFRDWSEKKVNHWIQNRTAIDDHLRIRRELIGRAILGRTRDGRSYWVEPFEIPIEFERFLLMRQQFIR